MNKIKTIFLFVLTVFMFGSFVKPAEAGIIKTYRATKELVEALTDETGENMQQLVQRLGTSSAIVGVSNICTEPECIGSEESGRVRNSDLPDSLKLGLIGIAENNVMAMFESQPRIDVIAHLSEEWIPGYKDSQVVYASGYDDLATSGVGGLWNYTRNFAYLGFVVIMIVIGFMIMFRNKIGGQTMVTIGNTIPRVIVGLILVTFSFAIIGLILDISGVLMRVIIGIFGGVDIHNIFQLMVGTLGMTGIGGLGVGAIVGGVLLLIPGGVVIGLIAWIIVLIVLGVLLFGVFKLWFTLIKSYFSILINLVTAPVVIMFGSLPGNNTAISNLFKSVLRNALVFPLAYAIVNLPHFLMGQTDTVNLGFPASVVGGDTMDLRIPNIILAIAKIMAIFVAAQAPEFMKAIIPASASKSGADVAGAIKAGFGKVPLIGGMFGK